MLFAFVICYLIMTLISLRFKREAYRTAMEKTDNSITNNNCNCNGWENITYYNDMIYCKQDLQHYMLHEFAQ